MWLTLLGMMLISVLSAHNAPTDAWKSFFRVNQVLNVSWPHKVPAVFMPDIPLMRVAIARMNTVPEESATLQRFFSIFGSVCRGSGGRAMFVDSGANEGFWSLLAAAHGCTVLAIEPQPYCARLIRAAGERSGVMSNVQLRTMAYAENTSGQKPCVPVGICKGTASYAQGKVTDIRDSAYSVQVGEECFPVPLVTLDELVPSEFIELWHLDVEGAELAALRSARKLLAERRIRRIMMEVDSMQRWRMNIHNKLRIDESLAEVKAIFEGWNCTSVCDNQPFRLPSHFQWGGAKICSNMYCVAPDNRD
tara:strand:+ start:139 stop:1056 length:918 start_codon:yes stop_codon:yes gene_type:complete